MTTFRVRKATIEDVPVMVKMQLAMAWETEKLELDQATLTRGMIIPFERDNVADYYVAEDPETAEGESSVAAMLMTTQEWSDWRAGTILWIQSVYVLPKYRRKGVFRSMYAYLKQMVTNSDLYQGLRLYVETENTQAIGTYEAMGMEEEHYKMMKWTKGDF